MSRNHLGSSLALLILAGSAMGVGPCTRNLDDFEELEPVCGDGRVDPGEVCDGTALGEATCRDLTRFEMGALGCQSDCRAFVLTGCHTCGDGVVNGPEECDGQDLGGATCETLGYAGGTLVCAANCSLDAANCSGSTDCGNGLCEPARGESPDTCAADCTLPACPQIVPPGETCISGWVRYLLAPDGAPEVMQRPVGDPQALPDERRLQVKVWDALIYAENPDVAPDAVAVVDPRTGAFLVESVRVPPTSFLAVGIDDHPEAAIDGFVFTFTMVDVHPGVNHEGITAWAITTGQQEGWSGAIGSDSLVAAGCDPGDTLLACGSMVSAMGTFAEEGFHGLAGVTLRRGDAPLPLAQSFYFDETYSGFVQPVDLASHHTGVTGMLLSPRSGLAAYTATCADLTPDSECESGAHYFGDEVLTGGISGAITVQVFPSVVP